MSREVNQREFEEYGAKPPTAAERSETRRRLTEIQPPEHNHPDAPDAQWAGCPACGLAIRNTKA